MGQTLFRSDDTIPWWLKFGNGTDGVYSSTGNATDAPIDSSCSGTIDTNSLSATNASFSAGKPILIHQTRGTAVGSWELNQISSYVAGTITTVSPLKNTYTDSGASQAQVIQLKQYFSFTQNSGHTLTAKSWDGNVGGIIAFLCTGTTTITGNLSAAGVQSAGDFVAGVGCGYSGGITNNTPDITANQGEGSSGAGITSTSSNGTGGGGASTSGGGGGEEGAGGGGGGHYATGTAGGYFDGGVPGNGGGIGGSADLTTMIFGGGGGGGKRDSYWPEGGGGGGGIIFFISKDVTISGTISVNGASIVAGDASGGAGAGGSVLIKCQTATLGTNKITSSGGSGGVGGSDPSYRGGAGSVGRIHIDYLTSYSGTTSPTITATQDNLLRKIESQSMFV